MFFSLKEGQTPLHSASVGGHDKTVTVLLENGANVDLQNAVSGDNDTPATQVNLVCGLQDGWTSLILAAKQGQDKVVKTLLEHGATVDIKSKVSRHNYNL